MVKRLFIVLSVLIVVGLGVAWLLSRRGTTNAPATTNGNANAAVAATNAAANANAAVKPEEADRQAMLARAILVTERFGSYSSQTVGRLADTIAPFLTKSGSVDVVGFVNQERARLAATDQSLGFTTRALNPSVLKYQRNVSATVEVAAIREAQAPGQEATVTNPSLHLELVFENNDWKVSHIRWR